MRSKLLRLIGTALILVGICEPVVFEMSRQGAEWSLGFGQPAFAYEQQDGIWTAQLTANESRAFTLATVSSFELDNDLVDDLNMAPGDQYPPEVPNDPDNQTPPNLEAEQKSKFRFAYNGNVPVELYLSTTLSGPLTTCSGGGKFTIEIFDENNNRFSANDQNQRVRELEPGDTVEFRTKRKLDLSADNECQNQSATFTIEGRVEEIVRNPPTNPPPISNPNPILRSGTVRVLDGSLNQSGTPSPIVGATVSLSSGQTGQTDASGMITFANLAVGSYEVTVTAEDPLNPGPAGILTGRGTLNVTPADVNVLLTVILAWDRPSAPPNPPAPPDPPPTTPPANPPTDPPPGPPSTPPGPSENPRVPQPPATLAGSILVRVFDASPSTNGSPKPIANARVSLKDGPLGNTNGTGEVLFAGLTAGKYEVMVEADHPQGPETPDPRQAFSSVVITPENLHETVTILLSWEEVSAPATPAGGLVGRICAPAGPGTEVLATGPDGKTRSLFMAGDGVLGVWRTYQMNDVLPGTWKVALKTNINTTAAHTVTVNPGEMAQVPDFTLACTGDQVLVDEIPLWPYMLGLFLVIAGVLMRRSARFVA